MKKLLFIFLILYSFASCGQKELLLQPPIDLTSNLIAYYKMDETSGNMIDSVNAYNMTVNGALQGQSGLLGNSYYFNGTSDYCTGSSPLDEITGDSLTITAWVKFDTIHSGQSDQVIWMDRGSTGDKNGAWIIKRQTGYNYTSAGYVFWNSSSSVPDVDIVLVKDTWYLMTCQMVLKSGSQDYRPNTNASALQNYTNHVRSNDGFNNGNTSYIGRYFSTSKYFEGFMDEIYIWNKILTQSELHYLYNYGEGREITGY